MSHLAVAIDQLMHEHQRTGADLARTTGLNPAQISRWKNADQISIKPDCLQRLACGFSSTPDAHARLLFAHLQDECSAPGESMISLELRAPARPAKRAAAPERPRPILAPSIQVNLDIIASRLATDQHVREMVETAANYCRRQLLPKVRLKTGFHAL